MERENNLKCNSCNSKEFQRAEGIYALTEVLKTDNKVRFLPGSGIPVVVYICRNCGEIKLFPAKLLGEI